MGAKRTIGGNIADLHRVWKAVTPSRYQHSPRHSHVRKEGWISAERGEASLDINPHTPVILGVGIGPCAARSARAGMHNDRRHKLTDCRKFESLTLATARAGGATAYTGPSGRTLLMSGTNIALCTCP